jgi:hypothetical protein
VGVRNRATILLEAMADEEVTAIATKVFEMAKAGDLLAAKLIFDRVALASKARPIAVRPSAIDEWDETDAVRGSGRKL